MDGNIRAQSGGIGTKVERVVAVCLGIMMIAVEAALLIAGTAGSANAQSTQLPGAAARSDYSQPAAPVKPEEHQAGFYDVEQLERLFAVAKEAGFGEDELRRITIEDEHGKTINAWDYLQDMKRRKNVKGQGDQERLQRIFLTVQDVLAELKRREKQDLRDLRDKSVFKE